MSQAKLVVAIGGTLRDGSSTEAGMRRVLYFAEQQGARTRIFAGATLEFPFYMSRQSVRVQRARDTWSNRYARPTVSSSDPPVTTEASPDS
jgi:hypothetical protein